ncbi:calpastatin isoform X9 [Dendrobates tinctorius]|uniref:calpastatin isoform X9 n=1 Tax=Dendrobates tinctorius TaxID=92724 RepID=UPI003CC9946E
MRQCGKKTDGTSKPTDKKSNETAEKNQSASAGSSAGAASSSRVTTPQEKTMKPADTKLTYGKNLRRAPKPTPKTEPAKSTQASTPKSTTTVSSTVKSSTEKVQKEELKAASPKQKSDTTAKAGAVGKAAVGSAIATSKPKDEAKAGAVGKVAAPAIVSSKPKDEAKAGAVGKAAAVGTATVAAAGTATVAAAGTAIVASKAKDEVKEEKKKVTVEQISAAPGPSDSSDALDLLIDSLGSPGDVPESPKFTGPEVTDVTATSEYVDELGKRESTIPPEYRHLLDGKGEKPAAPAPEDATPSLGEDDLVAAFSSDFVSCQAPPEEKRLKLEEKKEAKPILAPSAPVQPSSAAISEDALDELLDTLEGPPTTEPESPQFTGPEVTETVTKSYLEELGKRDHTIPPEYRHLLDGKGNDKSVPPPAEQPPPMSDDNLVDEFSKDFESSIFPAAETTPAFQAKFLFFKDAAREKQAKSDLVVPTAASSVQAAAAPSAGMESALDELMGTLEGPEFSVPESPVYTGPEVMETSTVTHIEELGKREGSIPPAYRHLLDGKEDGKPVLPPPEEKPMSEGELADAFDKEFSCALSPAAQQTPSQKPKDAPEVKKSDADVVCSSSSSALQSAPAPSKAPTAKADPLDALAGTLGTRKEDPQAKKPAVDEVKEKTGKEKKEKLGEDEETIPPDYRLKEVKDKDGKPLLPTPEEKPKAMSEDELLDALTEGFDLTPVPSQCAPLQSSAKAPGKSQSEIVSCSKASAVQSSAAKPSASIPDDALDLLSGSLGDRQPDPDENKPIVDVVKERAKEEKIEKLGDRDDTIPPEYRHLLDGKDQGKPAKPEAPKPQKSLDDAAAIDQLSGGFTSCETASTDKTKNSSKDKAEKTSSSTPVSKAPGKESETAKAKVEISSVHKTETSGKAAESSKSTTQSSLEKPSAQKTSKS